MSLVTCTPQEARGSILRDCDYPLREIYPQGHRANKGSICRYDMLDSLLKASPLRARGRGPFNQVRGRCSLRTSPLRSSLKFGLCNNLWEMHWPGTIDTRAPSGGQTPAQRTRG